MYARQDARSPRMGEMTLFAGSAASSEAAMRTIGMPVSMSSAAADANRPTREHGESVRDSANGTRRVAERVGRERT